MIRELVGDEPGADGEGVLARQGGVEQLRPGVLRMAADVLDSAQHPDRERESCGPQQQYCYTEKHITQKAVFDCRL